MNEARHAVYFAPAAGSPWDRFGAAWLGCGAGGGDLAGELQLPDHDARWLRVRTRAARRYGFHATLRSPFRLRDEVQLAQLRELLARLASARQPIELGPLRPVVLGHFVALVPSAAAAAALESLARDCVLACEALRAPLAPAELGRRAQGLDARGLELLAAHGYPHVMERFQFHLTLSDVVESAAAQRLLAVVAPRVEQLNRREPLLLDRLVRFVEPAPGADFQRCEEFLLAGRAPC